MTSGWLEAGVEAGLDFAGSLSSQCSLCKQAAGMNSALLGWSIWIHVVGLTMRDGAFAARPAHPHASQAAFAMLTCASGTVCLRWVAGLKPGVTSLPAPWSRGQ